jgi:peptidoglycan/LPS O-acetylase OafA/YrhL
MTPETEHKNYLDGWRGMSILLLLAGHFDLIPTIAGHTIYTGRLGVECFFVLSGRLMAEILFVRRKPLLVFYQRRISRIFPALWLLVGALLVTGIADATGAIRALTFTANYWPAGEPLEHLWSVCIEEHAYVLLSVLAFLDRRTRTNPPLVLALICIACIVNGAVQTFVFHKGFNETFWHSDVRLSSVFMSAALYLKLRETKLPQLGLWPAVLIIAGFAISIPYSIPDPIKYSLGTLLITIGFLSIQRGSKMIIWALSTLPATQLGIWSFSIYLWQQPFYVHEDQFSTWLLLGCAIPVALLSFYLVERPARALINRLSLPTEQSRPETVGGQPS